MLLFVLFEPPGLVLFVELVLFGGWGCVSLFVSFEPPVSFVLFEGGLVVLSPSTGLRENCAGLLALLKTNT